MFGASVQNCDSVAVSTHFSLHTVRVASSFDIDHVCNITPCGRGPKRPKYVQSPLQRKRLTWDSKPKLRIIVIESTVRRGSVKIPEELHEYCNPVLKDIHCWLRRIWRVKQQRIVTILPVYVIPSVSRHAPCCNAFACIPLTTTRKARAQQNYCFRPSHPADAHYLSEHVLLRFDNLEDFEYDCTRCLYIWKGASLETRLVCCMRGLPWTTRNSQILTAYQPMLAGRTIGYPLRACVCVYSP